MCALVPTLFLLAALVGCKKGEEVLLDTAPAVEAPDVQAAPAEDVVADAPADVSVVEAPAAVSPAAPASPSAP